MVKPPIDFTGLVSGNNNNNKTETSSSTMSRRRDDFFNKPGTGAANAVNGTGTSVKYNVNSTTNTNGNGTVDTAALSHRQLTINAAAAHSAHSTNVHHNGNGEQHSNGHNARSTYNVPKRDYSAAPNARDIVGYVGFANIPNQVFRRAIKRGFDFTLMVVGQSGLGKSTFINSLLLTDVYPPSTDITTTKTLKVNEQTLRLEENGVALNLTLVDTPGFGDAIDNSKCWEPVTAFVDKKYSDYFSEETKIHRKERIEDRRVHCLLYFIQPSGHGLKSIDVEFMKRVHERANIVPVIAKADTLTPEELIAFKRTITREIKENGIKVYQFPDSSDPDEQAEMAKLKERVPFAVIGSNTVQDMEGRRVRCRRYPWGTVEVDNLDHNDFIALRNMLIRSNLIDLIDVTRGVHYENFRCRQLMAKPGAVGDQSDNKDPFTQLEFERRQSEAEIQRKTQDMEKILASKSGERESMIREKEVEAKRQEDSLKERVAQKQADRNVQYQKLKALKEQYPSLATQADSRASLQSASSQDRSPDSQAKKKVKSSTLSMFSRHKD